MDRSKWEYKKLGEVATFERGLTYSKGDEATFSSKGVLRSNNIDLDTHQLVFDEIKYLNPNFVIPESKKLKKDSIFICMSNGSKAHLGKVAFADKDYDYAFGGFMGMIVPKDIYPRYLFYYFLSHNYRNGLEQVGKGANINNLRFAQLAEFMVPTPFISDQQRIVAELDCLNEMIAVKQEQLKEFDKLAQSIFYDMFGDPVANEKGWEKSNLKDVCSKINDGTHNSPVNEETGDYMYVTAKNIKKDGIILDSITYVSESIHRQIYVRCNPEYGDVLYIKDGVTTGIATINTLKEEFSLLSSVALLKPGTSIINYYLKAVLNTPSMYNLIRSDMGGVAITRLTIAKINKISIPLPPLSLQQQFAEKISAIEAQKELVKQSIAETQALLDYTMDKYFG